MYPVNILDIDLTRIDIKEPLKQEYGAMVYLTYNGTYFPDIVMPDLEVGNAKKFESERGEASDNYVVYLNFKGDAEDTARGKKLRQVQEQMTAIQMRIRDLLVQRTAEIKKAYPKGKYDEDKIASQFSPILSTYTNEETGVTYPTSFKAEIQRQRDNPGLFNSARGKALLIDRYQKEIPVTTENVFDEIKRGASLKTILRFGYVFVGKSAITIKLRIVHAIRTKVAPEFDGYVLKLDQDEDETPQDRIVDRVTDRVFNEDTMDAMDYEM
ncbi:hypothetical protein GGF32_005335 [Allomyces javanicus]|nr:hypothetical protein GGF32_005335 [Allomyces javanicus]